MSEAEISVRVTLQFAMTVHVIGGDLAYIKNTLKFEHLKSFLSTSIESIWLKLFLGNKKVITGTVYLSNVNTSRFQSLMEHLEIV